MHFQEGVPIVPVQSITGLRELAQTIQAEQTLIRADLLAKCENSSSSSGTNAGIIAASVIGALLLATLLGLVIWAIVKAASSKKKQTRITDLEQSNLRRQELENARIGSSPYRTASGQNVFDIVS